MPIEPHAHEQAENLPLSAPEAADLLHSDQNRREHGRTSFGVQLLIHELDEAGNPGEPSTCTGFDISRSGLGIRSRRMFYEGRKVLIQVILPTVRPRYLCGIVKYSRYTYKGTYHIGIEFCPLPQTDGMRTWLRAIAIDSAKPR